jgi:uncharacterized protein
MITIGVLGDTHIPDRTRQLHPGIIPCFQEAGVQAILHTGDISTRPVLDELGRVAPVYAVRGNRDWLLRHLPLTRQVCFENVTIGLTHGHMGMCQYLKDKPYLLFHTYSHQRLFPRLLAAFPQAGVIVFGHAHLPLNRWVDGRLIFNPGTPLWQRRKRLSPSVGLLRLQTGREVVGEIVELE